MMDTLIMITALILCAIIAPFYFPVCWWLDWRRSKRIQKLCEKAGGTCCNTNPFDAASYAHLRDLQETMRVRRAENDRHLIIAMETLATRAAQAAQQFEVFAGMVHNIIVVNPSDGAFAKAWKKHVEARRKQKEIDDFYKHEWRTS